MIDIDKIRGDFTILRDSSPENFVYFDNACMSLKPDVVVKAIEDYYFKYPACAGRSSHRLSNTVTKLVRDARESVARFLNAQADEIIFTRNTTEGVNLLANSFPFKRGDKVLITDKEHNSNLVPWLLLRDKLGIEVQVVRSKEDGSFDIDKFKEMIPGVRLVSFVHTSNLDGTSVPAKEIVKVAHEHGALVFLDMAQSIMHTKPDVKDLDVDFLAFSGHKVLGPTGTGVFYGKSKLLDTLGTFMVGGDTVARTTYDSFVFLPVPEKFEAGLYNYADIIGLGEAIKYMEKIDYRDIASRELEMNTFITNAIREFPKVKIIGPEDPGQRSGIVNFYIDGMDMHRVAIMLDEMAGVAVRSGQHCVHSWFEDKGVKNSARVSLAFYNTMDEARVFVENFRNIMSIL